MRDLTGIWRIFKVAILSSAKYVHSMRGIYPDNPQTYRLLRDNKWQNRQPDICLFELNCSPKLFNLSQSFSRVIDIPLKHYTNKTSMKVSSLFEKFLFHRTMSEAIVRCLNYRMETAFVECRWLSFLSPLSSISEHCYENITDLQQASWNWRKTPYVCASYRTKHLRIRGIIRQALRRSSNTAVDKVMLIS